MTVCCEVDSSGNRVMRRNVDKAILADGRSAQVKGAWLTVPCLSILACLYYSPAPDPLHRPALHGPALLLSFAEPL